MFEKRALTPFLSMAMEDTDSLSSTSLLFLREAQQADEECGRLRNQMKSATQKR
jgi:hypothetical protein